MVTVADIWITSDTHFNHENILEFTGPNGEKRGWNFHNVDHMNEMLIQNWNERVKPGDKVYHLGDVFMGDKEKFKKLWPQLSGKKRLIVGNHDDIKFLASGGFFEKVEMWRIFKEHNMVLTHVPIMTENFRKVDYNVHGHIHFNKPPTEQHVCVCVEQTGYHPLHIEEVLYGKTKRT